MNRSGSCASRGSGGWFQSIETIAPAPAKPAAPQARTSSHTSLGPECRRQHGRPADQHRRQHRRCRAEVEQRHRGPQHLTRVEFPGRGHRRRPRRTGSASVVATAFDGPVVPDVKNSAATSPGSAGAASGGLLDARANASDSESLTTRTDRHRVHAVDRPRSTRGCRSASVMTTLARDSRSACTQEVALVGGVHRGGHRADARRTQPEVHPLGAGRREQRDACRPGRHPCRATRSRRRRTAAASARTSPRVPAIDIITRSRILLGAPIQHGRHGEAFDTEICDGPHRPAPAGGLQAPAAAGSGSPSAVYPKSSGDGSVPG